MKAVLLLLLLILRPSPPSPPSLPQHLTFLLVHFLTAP